jgi:hypothetical protein
LSVVASGPAVVVLIACNVDNSHLPGLPNELPNHQGIPVVLPSEAGGGGGGTGGGTTTASGPAMSLCDCAASFTDDGTQACITCSNATCTAEYDACQAGDCGGVNGAIACVAACLPTDGACIAACIVANPDYQAFLDCLFAGCASSCGVATPLTCPLPDGGTDAGNG